MLLATYKKSKNITRIILSGYSIFKNKLNVWTVEETPPYHRGIYIWILLISFLSRVDFFPSDPNREAILVVNLHQRCAYNALGLSCAAGARITFFIHTENLYREACKFVCLFVCPEATGQSFFL